MRRLRRACSPSLAIPAILLLPFQLQADQNSMWHKLFLASSQQIAEHNYVALAEQFEPITRNVRGSCRSGSYGRGDYYANVVAALVAVGNSKAAQSVVSRATAALRPCRGEASRIRTAYGRALLAKGQIAPAMRQFRTAIRHAAGDESSAVAAYWLALSAEAHGRPTVETYKYIARARRALRFSNSSWSNKLRARLDVLEAIANAHTELKVDTITPIHFEILGRIKALQPS